MSSDPERIKRERVSFSRTAISTVDAEYKNPLAFAHEVVEFSKVPHPAYSASGAEQIIDYFKHDRASSLVGFNKEMKKSCDEGDTVLTLKSIDGIYQKLSYFLALRLMSVPNVTIAVVTAGANQSAWLLTLVQARFFHMGRGHLVADTDVSRLIAKDDSAASEYVAKLQVQPEYNRTPIKKTVRTLVTLSGAMDARGVKPNLLIIPDCSVMYEPPFYELMKQFLTLKDMRIVIIDSEKVPMPKPVRQSRDIEQLFHFNQEELLSYKKKTNESASSSRKE